MSAEGSHTRSDPRTSPADPAGDVSFEACRAVPKPTNAASADSGACVHRAAAPAGSETSDRRVVSANSDACVRHAAAPASSSGQRAETVNTVLAGVRVRAVLSENPFAPLVCVIADPTETQASAPAHQSLLVVDPGDWNDSLSPWPAPACFRGGGAFGGHADRFLHTLTASVLPAAERELGLAPVRRALCGYSLAGLFALYALFRTDAFTHIASASGSLWYDGFLDFLRMNAPRVPDARVRLSLGDREEFTKNPRLASVGSATREAERILRGLKIDVTLTMNPGNHFSEPDARLSRLIESLAM